VINEVLTGTVATSTEEFVEVFNPCSTAFNLDGWRLVYRSANNTTPANLGEGSPLVTLQGILPPGGYLVFGGPGYHVHSTSSGALQSGIAANGAVGLRDRDLRLIDSVGFGQVPGNAFVEGTPAPAAPVSPTPGLSISRSPDGADSNDNSRDFTVTTPTPMAANARPGTVATTPPPNVPTGIGSTILPQPGPPPAATGAPDQLPPWSRFLPPGQRFELVLGGAAVLDRETDLVWEKSPDPNSVAWYTAIQNCAYKAVGGRKGWRLPSVAELASLIDPSVLSPGPTLPLGHPFTNVSTGAGYWSATSIAAFPTNVWGVQFRSGQLQAAIKTGQGALGLAWCVRGSMNADAY
jgi:hypothetical protein